MYVVKENLASNLKFEACLILIIRPKQFKSSLHPQIYLTNIYISTNDF